MRAMCVPGRTGVWRGEDVRLSTVSDDVVTPTAHAPNTRRVGTCALARPAESKAQHFSDAAECQIAVLGAHISRGVTSHGLALNVNTDLSFFNLIVPCGINSKPVTSMQRELSRPIPLQDVAHALSRNFGTVFTSQILWLESLDALLGTNLGVPMKAPENVRRIHSKDDPAWA